MDEAQIKRLLEAADDVGAVGRRRQEDTVKRELEHTIETLRTHLIRYGSPVELYALVDLVGRLSVANDRYRELSITSSALRDVIINAHGMATERHIQTDTEMRARIGRLLEKAIDADPIMCGFLGRGGPEASRDVLGGQGRLGG